MKINLLLWIISCIVYCNGYEAEIISTNSVLYAASDTLNITCKINTIEEVIIVYFFKNGMRISNALLVDRGRFCYPEQDFICDYTNKLFTYTLTSEEITNGETWSCRADGDGQLSKEVTITVVEPFSSIIMTVPFESIYTTDVNLRRVFECVTSLSRPDAAIVWYKQLINGTQIELANGTFNIEIMQNASMTWTRSKFNYTAKESDNGSKILCKGFLSKIPADNPKESRKIQLNIRYPPAEEPQTNNNGFLTVVEGYNIEIVCYISGGNPIASLSWNCNNKHVSAIHTINETTFMSLMSLQANSALNGESCYCCASHPLFVEKKVKTELNILFSPLKNVTITSSHVQYINASSNVTLQCLVYSGNPIANATWSCDNIFVSSVKTDLDNSVISTTTFRVEKNDNGRRCTCSANHFLWKQQIKKHIVLNVYFSPDTDLKISGGTNETVFYEKDTVAFSCTLRNGNPVAKLTFKCWKSTIGVDTSNSTTAVSLISSTAMQSFNNRICKCTAEHILFQTTLEKSIHTTVYYPPMKPQLSFIPSQPLLEGQDVDVTCDAVEGNPHISTYEWTLNGNHVNTIRKTISFKNITSEINQQRVTCRVNNAFTDFKRVVVISSTETFNVHYRPRIVQFDKTITTTEGMTVNQTCLAIGNPVPNVQWFYKNNPISTENAGTSDLSLLDINRNQKGEYYCKATVLSNAHGHLESRYSLQIIVNYAPTIQRLQIPNGHAVDEYTSVTLQCDVDSNPVPDIQWTYSVTNILLQKDENVYESNYTIPKTNCLQTGSYRCEASNVIDEILVNAYKEIILYVLCSVRLDQRHPEAPDTMHIFESNQLNITVFFVAYPKPYISWTMRNYETGINSIVNFNNSYNIFEHISTVYISQVSQKDYGVYTITAFNTIGLQYMQSIAVMPPRPPGEPKDILVACETTSMIVSWLSGQTGGDKQSFHIAWLNTNTQQTSFSSAIFDSSQGKHRQYLVDSLIPDTLYIIFIVANNSAGSVRSVDANCTTKSVSYNSQSNNAIVIGFGGGIGSTVVIFTVIGLVVIVFRKRRCSAKNNSKLYQSSHCGTSRQDVNVDQHIYDELQTFKRELNPKNTYMQSTSTYEEVRGINDANGYQDVTSAHGNKDSTQEKEISNVYTNMII